MPRLNIKETLRVQLEDSEQKVRKIRATYIVHLESMLEDTNERITELEAERDKAQANYQFMVNRACNEKLDGYRELGSKCASLEEERDVALTEVARLKAEIEEASEEISDTQTQADHWASISRDYEIERDALKTEVEQLHESLAQAKGEIERLISVSKYEERETAEARAEVERLHAHTWQAERAAAVKWLRHPDRWNNGFTRSASYYATHIERDEHWPPERGTP